MKHKPMHNLYYKDGGITATIDGSIMDNSIHRSPDKQVSDLDDKLLDGVRLKKCILGCE